MWRLALLAPLVLAGPDASLQPEKSEHVQPFLTSTSDSVRLYVCQISTNPGLHDPYSISLSRLSEST
jgi:hypothetical protein